jgi:hypothetical protein
MDDPYTRNLLRECAAYGIGLTLSAAISPLLLNGRWMNPFTIDFVVGVLVMAALVGFIAAPLFLMNVLFFWQFLHNRVSKAKLIVIEALLLCAGMLVYAGILHAMNGFRTNSAIWAYAFIVYTTYRISSWTIEWLIGKRAAAHSPAISQQR